MSVEKCSSQLPALSTTLGRLRLDLCTSGGDQAHELAKFLAFLAPDSNVEEIVEAMRGLPLKAIEERMQRVMLERLRDTPIMSFCKRADNFLMWSYYAKGHCGYAYVLAAHTLPAAAAVRVRYARWHPRILLSRRDMTGISRDVLATKARQWRHEEEWRVIAPSDAAAFGLTDFHRVNADGYIATIPKDALAAVIVGDQLYSGPHGDAVLSLLRAHANNVPVRLAEIDRTEFRIVMRPLRFG